MATKNDLLKNLCLKNDNIKQEDMKEIVDHVLEYIKNSLSQNNRVEIRGFGSFSVRTRKSAGQDKIYNTIYYRMSKNIFDMINKGDN